MAVSLSATAMGSLRQASRQLHCEGTPTAPAGVGCAEETIIMTLGRLRLSVPDARDLAEGALRGIGYHNDEARIIADHVIDAAMCGYAPYLPRRPVAALRKRRLGCGSRRFRVGLCRVQCRRRSRRNAERADMGQRGRWWDNRGRGLKPTASERRLRNLRSF